MAEKKSKVQIVFAEFPDWSKLTKADITSLYEQMCQLWKDSEKDKATQLFDYLFENGFDDEKLDSFAESADVDFQFHYVRKLTDVLGNGSFSRAKHWLKEVKKNDPDEIYGFEDLDEIITGEVSDKLQEINQQIVESFYEKHKKKPWKIFMGEQYAVLNDYEAGHIEFVGKEICSWDAINGAQGLILAKDKPVERSKFKMTGFSPELKALMTKLSKNSNKYNCYPNIINYSPFYEDENGEYEEDDFQTECEKWKILLQLLSHGYSLVDKQEYTLENSKFLPKAIQDRIKEWRKDAIKRLMDDDDDDDNDDDLNIDDLNIDLEDKAEKPAKKSQKSKKK